jgi:hypothetical protein
MKKLFTLLVLFIISTVLVNAQKLPFQGYLEESGVPVEGTRDFTFSLSAYSWTETFSAVPVTNGVYNVVLGSNNPLPGNLFNNVDETAMEISVNANSIGSITLYKPIVNSLDIKGVNDSTNVIVGSTTDGYYGNLAVYDSIGTIQGFLRAGSSGGRLQLNKFDVTGAFEGAILANTSNFTPSLRLLTENAGETAAATVINNYVSGREPLGGPVYSGNYRRSGTDWSDNTGRMLVAVGGNRLQSGGDPTGASGYIAMFGTDFQNFNISGQIGNDNNLPIFEMFGNNDNSGSPMRNITLDVSNGAGTDNQGNILLANTDNGGITTDAVVLTSNLNANGGGGLELKNNTGANTIILDGQSGNISSTRASDGGAAVSIFQNSESGGIAIQNAADENNFFYEAEANNLELKNAGLTTISADGTSGQAFFYNSTGNTSAQVGASGSGEGYVRLLGPNGGANILIERDALNANLGQLSIFGTNGTTPRILASAGTNGTDQFGIITVNSPVNDIVLDGETGDITATVVAPSDRRFKKDINTIENALENTIKMRGTSYYWKDEKKSQQRQIGVIAQEVEKIYPEFVHTNKEGYKAVNYAQMTALLIEAVKELNAKIIKLESDNKELTTALNEQQKLNNRITKLEKLLLENTKVATND